MKLFRIYDIKAEGYQWPFPENNAATAIRALESGPLSNENHEYAKHPEDFVLFEVGEVSNETADIIPCEPKKLLCLGELTENPAHLEVAS